jgi:hypothetical protein
MDVVTDPDLTLREKRQSSLSGPPTPVLSRLRVAFCSTWADRSMTTLAMDPIDHEMALRRLAATEEAVARARDHTARQREIVARLESAGQDTAQARQLLATFEATLANHERRLAMFLDELTQRGWKHRQP